MSEFDFNSPPAAAPPPMASPALPYTVPPIPVQSLPYSISAYGRQRPGIITAIGVISIVVACLSALTSLFTGIEALGFFMTAKMSNVMSRTSSSTTTTSGTTTYHSNVSINGWNSPPSTTPPPSATPFGLNDADKSVAMTALAELETMNAERRNQLDAFLAQNGTRMFPTAGAALSSARVKIAVSSHYGSAGSSDDPGSSVFVTSWGTLKIYDSKSEFSPADGSSAITISAADSTSANSGGSAANSGAGTTGSTGGPGLTPAEIRTIVQKANQATGNKLTTAQLASLTTTLQDPNQQLITPGTAWSPIRSANVAADGSAFIWLSGGFVSLNPQGVATSNNMSNVMPKISITGASFAMSAIDCALSIVLAIYLFVAGIMLLRQSPASRKLHRIYALLKIPLTFFGAAALGWLNYQFYGAVAATTPGGPGAVQSMAIGWAIGMCVLGLIYPIALLIALHTRGIREYYNSVRG